ncbi:MAG TPA: DUF192 domain-containing protein [Candidatus Nanopelagicales bacterium]|nr:DUF192 domain-containing protein [Candidatus Nanopelagicales bacterium]
MRPRLLAALAAALLLAAAPGCERRIEEPLGPPRDQGAWVGTTATPSPKPKPSRCLKPTPATPARVLKSPGPDPRCPADPTGNPDLRTGKVLFPEATAPEVLVELAENDEHRTRGLMFRKSMPEHQGMLFVFQDRRTHSFWMRNTCIPLDMLFIDEDGTIVGIEENTPTMTDATFQVGCPSTYVLELNAGWARKHGVKAGQKVKIEGI